MKNTIMAAVAATALLAPALTSPSLARNGTRGNAYGTQKVCLVTFSSETGNTGADADVVSARLLPLPAAMRAEARNDTLSDIYTYNESTQRSGVDYNIMSPNDPAAGITPDMNTAQACSALAAYAEQNQSTDDDDSDSDD